MKVCYIHHAGYPQIGRTSFYEYSQKAAIYGLDVSVICTKDNRGLSNAGSAGANVTVYEIPVNDWSRRGDVKFALQAARIVRDIKPDIVHCFHFRGVSLIPLSLRRYRDRPRFLLDIRSGHLSSGMRGFTGRSINYLETHAFDAVAFISPQIMKYAIGRNELTNKPVFHFPLGVDWRVFAHVEDSTQKDFFWPLEIPDSAVVGIYAGELSKIRDLSPLLFAIAKVVAEQPIFNFVFLGDGSDLQNLTSLAMKLGIEEYVFFLGRKPYCEIPLYYHRSHIGISYVPQSHVFDGQPALKLIEFMASGLAVVATDTLGQRSTISDGDNGLLVEDDADAIAAAVLQLVCDVDMRKQLGDNARQSAKEYDWDFIFHSSIFPAYEQILCRRDVSRFSILL
ncbi:MAG: glycosyltransferase family 4 protein [Candidatus Promineifilaceae bacterium]